MEAHFLYNPQGKRSFCHAPTLLETSAGDLLASWYAYNQEEHKDACLALVRRRQGQSEWEVCAPVAGSATGSVGNPVLFQEPAGRIWLLFVVLNGTYWNDALLEGVWSEDEGYSWSRPVRLWNEKGLMIKHPPVLRGDGSLMLPVYDESTGCSRLLVSRSPYDQWEEVYRFAGVRITQPVLVREAAGRLGLFFRPCSDPRRIWRSHSRDSGATWSVPMRTPLPNPLSGIGAFVVNRCIAVVYNHTEKHQRFPLSISLSRNGGTTWETPWHIDTIRHEVSYPSFFLGHNRVIHGVYTYNRRAIKYVSFDQDEFLRNYEPDR